LAQLNGLISNHPCFFDGARLTRLSPPDSQVYALLRESAEGRDFVLVLVNTDAEKEGTLALPDSVLPAAIAALDLLGQPVPKMKLESDQTTFILLPGAAFCLASAEKPAGLSGDAYRRVRAQAAFALEALNKIIPAEMVNDLDWHWLADQIERSPKNFLAAATELASSLTAPDDAAPAAEKESGRQAVLATLLARLEARELYPRVITWTLIDARRVTPVPAGHWLLIEDTAPFRVTLEMPDGAPAIHAQSIAAGNNHVAAFAPQCAAPDLAGPAVQTLPSVSPPDATLILERYATTSQKISAPIRFLSPQPQPSTLQLQPSDLVLLTNGRGGMARLCVDLGRVNSKYDCALGANLNASVPVDRHVFVKRIRLWVNAAGFLSALDFNNLAAFKPGAAPVWDFIANAGDSRTVEIKLRAEMPPGENTVVFQFSRPTEKLAQGKQLPADADVRLTVRLDIEDRNFHSETKRNGGADFHFASNCRELPDIVGFEFTPAADRQLRVFADSGIYHPQPEWCENIPHPVEQTRGQVGSGDAYSPGWFELPLAKGASVSLIATAEIRTDLSSAPPLALTATKAPAAAYLKSSSGEPSLSRIPLTETKAAAADDFFESQLYQAAKQFVVRRDAGKTVIAGYPWFLDWGRDSLICARGLLAGGLVQEVKQLLLTFAKFEKDGTLPNTIHGNDVSNRDTSDAPLWFAIVCEECFQREKKPAGGKASVKSAAGKFFETVVDDEGRTLRDVLTSIAENYSRGTPNGIRLDPDSALIWSPSHFTWMDTNYPAGTPREGYPVEIQALWIRLLRLLEKISAPDGQKKWRDLADHATASFEKLFWLEEKGWFADVLLGGARVIARDAVVSDALRSNCLFAVSLGLATGTQAKRCVEAARKYLVVPGGLRTLAPLPVSTPLPVIRDGGLLNDPTNPYWSHYEGDEDTRRKPAYHNGTAWTWTFPTFCEALARAWDNAPTAVAAAKSYLGSAEKLLNEGCLGQLPEILDGDRPHTQRGCDAQAWGATETLRVWKELGQLKIKS
jgi:predicted glycogen debranching enzyme